MNTYTAQFTHTYRKKQKQEDLNISAKNEMEAALIIKQSFKNVKIHSIEDTQRCIGGNININYFDDTMPSKLIKTLWKLSQDYNNISK